MTSSVWPNSYLTDGWRVRSSAKACIHGRGKESSSSGWTEDLSWWGSTVRLHLPELPHSSHYCGWIFPGHTSWNVCIQNVAKKRREEEERLLEEMHPHTRAHTNSSCVFMSLSPSSRFVLHHVFKQLHGSHHGFILFRNKGQALLVTGTGCMNTLI